MARKRHQHRNKQPNFDCVAPNRMRTSSVVNVHVKHKSAYGRYIYNANLHKAHTENKVKPICRHILGSCLCDTHIVDTVSIQIDS